MRPSVGEKNQPCTSGAGTLSRMIAVSRGNLPCSSTLNSESRSGRPVARFAVELCAVPVGRAVFRKRAEGEMRVHRRSRSDRKRSRARPSARARHSSTLA